MEFGRSAGACAATPAWCTAASRRCCWTRCSARRVARGQKYSEALSLSTCHLSQAYWAWWAPERGPGFTANLNVDYKAPVPAQSWLCITVDVLSEEGRKVRLAATVADAPLLDCGDEATVFATATCLFIVAAK